MCEAKTEKASIWTCHVRIKEMSVSEPSDEASRKRYLLSKPRHRAVSGISIAVTCLLAMWQSLFRGHDFYPGLFMEHGKPYSNVKGKVQVEKIRLLPKYYKVADEPVVVMKFL